MDTGLAIESGEQRVEREAKEKAEHDQQAIGRNGGKEIPAESNHSKLEFQA
jgi:hypothetical protein